MQLTNNGNYMANTAWVNPITDLEDGRCNLLSQSAKFAGNLLSSVASICFSVATGTVRLASEIPGLWRELCDTKQNNGLVRRQ